MTFGLYRKLVFVTLIITLFLSGCVEEPSVKVTKIYKDPGFVAWTAIYGNWVGWISDYKENETLKCHNLESGEEITIFSDKHIDAPFFICEDGIIYETTEGTHIYNLSTKKEKTHSPKLHLASIYGDKGISIERSVDETTLNLYNLTTMEKRVLVESPSVIVCASIYGSWVIWDSVDDAGSSKVFALDLKENRTYLLPEGLFLSGSQFLYGDKVVCESLGEKELWIYNLTTKEAILFKRGDAYLPPAIYGNLIAAVESKADRLPVLKVWDVDTKDELFSMPFAIGAVSIYKNRVAWAGPNIKDEETIESLRSIESMDAFVNRSDLVEKMDLVPDPSSKELPTAIYVVEIT